MLAFFRACEHHHDRHCPAEAKANYGRPHFQAAVTLLLAFVTPDSLLLQEPESGPDHACSHLFHLLDTCLDRLLNSTLRAPDNVKYLGITTIVFLGSD